MWLEGPRGLVFYTRHGMEVLEALFAQGRLGWIWSKTIMAARGDDSSYTAARGVDSWGADIYSGSVVMTATGILVLLVT